MTTRNTVSQERWMFFIGWNEFIRNLFVNHPVRNRKFIASFTFLIHNILCFALSELGKDCRTLESFWRMLSSILSDEGMSVKRINLAPIDTFFYYFILISCFLDEILNTIELHTNFLWQPLNLWPFSTVRWGAAFRWYSASDPNAGWSEF